MVIDTLKHSYYKLRGAQQLRVVVIKPTYRCTANCVFCEYRRDLASEIFKKDEKVSLERWLEIIKQAHDLGAATLGVSGGEPLLYKDIHAIFRYAKALGMRVDMNSNGSLITSPEKAVQLKESGVDGVLISLDSYDPEVHDNVRRVPGLWQRAINSIGFLQNAGIEVSVHTIISRHQYQTLDRLLELCIQLRVSAFQVAHVEADHENHHMLMTVEQIHDFKQHYLPKLIKIVRAADSIPETNKIKMIQGLSLIFPENRKDIVGYSLGRYGAHHTPLRQHPCLIPYYFSLILEDGSVLPCNAVEYTHDQTVGNILEDDYTNIWVSKKFDNFRKSRMEWCQTCPMQAHKILPLMQH